jgi:hypothetical protein
LAFLFDFRNYWFEDCLYIFYKIGNFALEKNIITMKNKKIIIIKLLLILSLLPFINQSFAQKTDSTKASIIVNGAITVTNSGISVIPTFTLGKPAIIFDLIVRKNKFSFEPQFRFAIEDFKPWSFIFWLRYKIAESQKFKMGAGVHPSTVFGNTLITTNGVTKEAITVRRFWAGDLSPTFLLSKNVSVGVYYLHSIGLADATKNTNFVALSGSFTNIKLGGDYFMKAFPQVYYLNLDEKEGYYVTSTFMIGKKNFPLSLASIVNKKIESTVPSDDFVWNVSLIYAY